MNHAEQENHVLEKYNDSSRKVSLLRGELDFNRGLVTSLEDVYACRKALDTIESAPLQKMHHSALRLDSLDVDINRLIASGNIGPFDLIRTRSVELRRRLDKNVQDYWSQELVQVDSNKGCITVTAAQGQCPSACCLQAKLCRFCEP